MNNIYCKNLVFINFYHEIHFLVIKVIYQKQNASRGTIWEEMNGVQVREDSMEADLFKMLISIAALRIVVDFKR